MALASLTTEYHVPKRPIAAEVTFLAHPRKILRLFLSERSAIRDGAERPSDLLNGPGDFLPAIEPPGRVVLLQRDALLVLTVSAELELGDDPIDSNSSGANSGTQVKIEATLQDASEIRGTVKFMMPGGKNRLVDFLNQPERFFAVREGKLARLVNKQRIVRMVIVSQDAER